VLLSACSICSLRLLSFAFSCCSRSVLRESRALTRASRARTGPQQPQPNHCERVDDVNATHRCDECTDETDHLSCRRRIAIDDRSGDDVSPHGRHRTTITVPRRHTALFTRHTRLPSASQTDILAQVQPRQVSPTCHCATASRLDRAVTGLRTDACDVRSLCAQLI
jgi:hypothetical protein